MTAQQKADQERYQNALYNIQNSDAYSEDEKQEAERRLVAKIGGIQPLPIRKDPSKYPKGQNVGEIWTDDATGTLVTRDKDGSPRKLADNPNVPTFRDIADLMKQAGTALTRPGAEPDDPPTLPTQAELEQYVEQAIKLRQKYAPQTGGQQAAAPAVALPAPTLPPPTGQQPQPRPNGQEVLREITPAGATVSSFKDIATTENVSQTMERSYNVWKKGKSGLSREDFDEMSNKLDDAVIAYNKASSPAKQALAYQEVVRQMRWHNQFVELRGR